MACNMQPQPSNRYFSLAILFTQILQRARTSATQNTFNTNYTPQLIQYRDNEITDYLAKYHWMPTWFQQQSNAITTYEEMDLKASFEQRVSEEEIRELP